MTKKAKTQSAKRHITSKSGASAPSTTKATSTRKGNSSKTAEHSFVLDGNPPNPLQQRIQTLRAAAMARLARYEQEAMPSNGILRSRLRAKISREKRIIRDSDELLAFGNR